MLFAKIMTLDLNFPQTVGVRLWSDPVVNFDYRAPILAQLAGWLSGASRRNACQPKLLTARGDTHQLIIVRSARTEQLSDRSWWPVERLWISFGNSAPYRGASNVS